MSEANSQQLQAIHASLHKKGLLKHKPEIISGTTNGRSSSSKDLTFEEARDLLISLNESQDEPITTNGPMIKKLFAMAFEMGWVKKGLKANNKGGVKEVNDYSDLHKWINNYGYLKKTLRQYKYNEMPKLVSQMEFGPYKDYISKLPNAKPQS